VERVRLVSIIVGLNEEPVIFAQFVVSMSAVGVTLNDHTFVSAHTRNDEIDGSTSLNSS